MASCHSPGQTLGMAVGWAQGCVACQDEADGRYVDRSLYNRRGSKDSQLK